ncbi:hypothetical protein EKO27_g9861, partial [Xylaria grammica]
MDKSGTRHWLDRYGNGYHAWIRDENGFSRPCGLCELKFDSDGRHFGGRADVNALLTLGVSTRLSGEALQHHILLAFTLLRLRHCLLMATAELRTLEVEPWFLVGIPPTAEAAIRDAGTAVRFLDPAVDGVTDEVDFYTHAQNVARIIKPSETLGRVFVLPQRAEGSARQTVHFLFVMAHEIVDGLSSMNWMTDFTRLVNTPAAQLRAGIEAAISPDAIR